MNKTASKKKEITAAYPAILYELKAINIVKGNKNIPIVLFNKKIEKI